jgi:hypothetical protein
VAAGSDFRRTRAQAGRSVVMIAPFTGGASVRRWPMVTARRGPACQTAIMPSLSDVFGLLTLVSLMGLLVAFAIWHTRRIRQGRADPIISPDWTSIERPVSPPAGIRWGTEGLVEVEDNHVGHPFPPQES